jgi:hypothetical protein
MERSVDAVLLSLSRAVANGDYRTAVDDVESLIRQNVVVNVLAEDWLPCSSHGLYFPTEENTVARSNIKTLECSHHICDNCVRQVIYTDLKASHAEAKFLCPVCIQAKAENPRPLFDIHMPYRHGLMYLTAEQVAEVLPEEGIKPGASRLEGECSYIRQTIGGYTCDGSGELTLLGNCSCKICKKCITAYLNSLPNTRLPRCPKANCNKIVNYYDILFLNEPPLNAKFTTLYGKLSLTCPTCNELIEGNFLEVASVKCSKNHEFSGYESVGL